MRFAISTSLLVALAACATPRVEQPEAPQLPPVPTHIRACFSGVTSLPAGDGWTSEVVAEVIAELRVSELAKTDCGRQLLAFYDELRNSL